MVSVGMRRSRCRTEIQHGLQTVPHGRILVQGACRMAAWRRKWMAAWNPRKCMEAVSVAVPVAFPRRHLDLDGPRSLEAQPKTKYRAVARCDGRPTPSCDWQWCGLTRRATVNGVVRSPARRSAVARRHHSYLGVFIYFTTAMQHAHSRALAQALASTLDR